MVETRSSNSLISILKGTILSIFLTLILLIIFALLLTYTNINENTMPAVIIIATAISILVGSQITTGKIKRNGIINGIGDATFAPDYYVTRQQACEIIVNASELCGANMIYPEKYQPLRS